MAKKSQPLARRIYDIVLSVSVFIAGICLMAGCLVIYTTGGDQPYSREIVTETLWRMALPLSVCAVLTVGSIVWELIAPTPERLHRPSPDYPFMLARLSSKKDIAVDRDAYRRLRKEHHCRLIHTLIRTVLLCAGCSVFAAYCIQGRHFDSVDINGSVIRAMLLALPCFAVPFGYAVFTAFYNIGSYKRELDILKTLPPKASEEAASRPHDRELFWIRVVLLAAGIGFLVYGFFAGGTADVLTKAVNICTECIGLG